jgi:hypothetical protein
MDSDDEEPLARDTPSGRESGMTLELKGKPEPVAVYAPPAAR